MILHECLQVRLWVWMETEFEILALIRKNSCFRNRVIWWCVILDKWMSCCTEIFIDVINDFCVTLERYLNLNSDESIFKLLWQCCAHECLSVTGYFRDKRRDWFFFQLHFLRLKQLTFIELRFLNSEVLINGIRKEDCLKPDV